MQRAAGHGTHTVIEISFPHSLVVKSQGAAWQHARGATNKVASMCPIAERTSAKLMSGLVAMTHARDGHTAGSVSGEFHGCPVASETDSI